MPDAEQAYATARDLLASSLPQRWAHVQGVAKRASLAALSFDEEDADILEASAVLHDIGYAPSLIVTGFHALDGASYLQNRGVSKRLCGLVAHHSCAYREAGLRGQSSALAEWEDEGTPLRDALWWADMTTTPDGRQTNVHKRIEEIRERYGPDDLVTLFIGQAKADLVAAVERTEQRLRAAGINYTVK
ncbi:HD domain-containing protein [Umezawaea sp. NPDC059074]|uniref:HD domain-containing protein n=1 Tax=Umezawaea sp. NPDC059074 TaxID=3346716 RepID=UPI0036AC62F6